MTDKELNDNMVKLTAMNKELVDVMVKLAEVRYGRNFIEKFIDVDYISRSRIVRFFTKPLSYKKASVTLLRMDIGKR